jgi:hypothetical protein
MMGCIKNGKISSPQRNIANTLKRRKWLSAKVEISKTKWCINWYLN